MIHIEPINDYKSGIKIYGHANANEHGKDIVCASVSVTTQMIAREIELKKLGNYHIKEDGELSIQIKETKRKEAQPYMEMLLRTLDTLAQQYPTYIKIKEEKI